MENENEDRMISSWRNGQIGIAGIVFIIVCTVGGADLILAGDDKTKEPAWAVDQAA